MAKPDESAKPADMAEPPAPGEPAVPPVPEVAESVDQIAGQDSTLNPYLHFEEVPEASVLAGRLGAWGVKTTGSKAGVGEWQGLDSVAPFFDVDGLFSNGGRTLDFFLTGPENEASSAGLYFYNGPGLSVDLGYDRFIHRLGNEPILKPAGGWFNPPLAVGTPGYTLWGEDNNVGQDYAIRVQTMKANFKGNLTENIKWKLNVWGMQKEGERQAMAVTHCFTQMPAGTPERRCHMVNRSQRIDWLTMEIEPVIEARLAEGLTLEYSRTMRSFQQNDQVMLNDYTGREGFQANPIVHWAQYGDVPETYTEIDRLKLGAQLGAHTDAYVLGYIGNTANKSLDANRHFTGVDGRVTDRTFDGLTLSGYGKTYSNHNRVPATVTDQLYSDPNFTPSATTTFAVAPNVDRDIWAVGAKGRWQPFHGESGTLRSRLALIGGYEYKEINRDQCGLPHRRAGRTGGHAQLVPAGHEQQPLLRGRRAGLDVPLEFVHQVHARGDGLSAVRGPVPHGHHRRRRPEQQSPDARRPRRDRRELDAHGELHADGHVRRRPHLQPWPVRPV